jgi:hypothetical protein
MSSKINPIARRNDIIVQELKDEVLVYDLIINRAYCLNESSAIVYNLCDGTNSVSDISNQLSKKLKSPFKEDLVWLAIDQFKQYNLLDNSQEIKTNFEELSRREVIRRVGFASMIAIPVVSSLIAPTASMAASVNENCVESGSTIFNTESTDCNTCRSELNAQCCSHNTTDFQCFTEGGISCQADCV